MSYGLELPISDTARDHVDVTWGYLPDDAKRLVGQIQTTIENIQARYMERIRPPTLDRPTATLLAERRPLYPREIAELQREYMQEIEPLLQMMAAIVSRHQRPVMIVSGLPLAITKGLITPRIT